MCSAHHTRWRPLGYLEPSLKNQTLTRSSVPPVYQKTVKVKLRFGKDVSAPDSSWDQPDPVVALAPTAQSLNDLLTQYHILSRSLDQHLSRPRRQSTPMATVLPLKRAVDVEDEYLPT